MSYIEQIEKPLHSFPFSSGAIVKIHKWPDDDDSVLEQSVDDIDRSAPHNNIHGNKSKHPEHLLFQITLIIMDMQGTKYRKAGPI